MSDLGHEKTEEQLEALEKRIAAEYRQAQTEVAAKCKEYFEQFEAGKAAQQEKLDAGEITQKEFSDWCFRHMMVGKRWEAMRDTLAQDLHKANEMATRIIGGAMPDVFALNANWATYNIEHSANIDTGFTLYSHETAELLLGDEKSLLPPPRKGGKTWTKLQENPDLVWNQRHIQSALLQGVLRGESPFAIAQRLQTVTDMDHNAAIRHARTMTTAAQNAGRESAYERAKDKGVELVIQWEATLDNVTRVSHRQLHGETRPDEPDAKFSNGCRYPGDPEGPDNEVYNCRCTTVSWVKGFEEGVVTHSDAMGEMTFEEWQEAKPQRKNG